MRVVVDTSAWSMFLRRHPRNLSPRQRRMLLMMRRLIADGDAILPGIVRQELLTGIRGPELFEQLAAWLRFFDDEPPDVSDYERAARFSNRCRDAGVATSPVDMLLCAIADGRGIGILTLDDDFGRYAKILGMQVHLMH